eukprot:SAG31_NODE_3551_length_4131_cov_2.490575_2_plen_89_part_00
MRKQEQLYQLNLNLPTVSKFSKHVNFMCAVAVRGWSLARGLHVSLRALCLLRWLPQREYRISTGHDISLLAQPNGAWWRKTWLTTHPF